jgi:hypothetical protein
MHKICLSFLICLYSYLGLSHAADWKRLHLVNECDIFNFDGVLIKSFPGSACIFLEDGRFFSATVQEIKLVNKDLSVAWSHKGHFHHQMNQTLDKKRFLVMSSNVLNEKHGLTRDDKLMILDLEGKIIHSTSSTDIYQQLNLLPSLRLAEPMLKELINVTHEKTHFNSFYEIPPNKLEKKYSYMKAGNFIVNGRGDGIFFLTPDLKKVLNFISYKGAFNHRVHDVQVLSNGHLLLFNNYVAGYDKFHHQSAIQEISPIDQKVVFSYQANPGVFFFVSTGGSVQKLNDDLYLFTHSLLSTYVYSKSNNDVVISIAETHMSSASPLGIRPTLQVKATDLSSFLSFWPK